MSGSQLDCEFDNYYYCTFIGDKSAFNEWAFQSLCHEGLTINSIIHGDWGTVVALKET